MSHHQCSCVLLFIYSTLICAAYVHRSVAGHQSGPLQGGNSSGFQLEESRAESGGIKRRAMQDAVVGEWREFSPIEGHNNGPNSSESLEDGEQLNQQESSIQFDYLQALEADEASEGASGLAEQLQAGERRLDIDPPGAARHGDVEKLVRDQVQLAGLNWATLSPGDYLQGLRGATPAPVQGSNSEGRVNLHPNHKYDSSEPMASTPSDSLPVVSSSPDKYAANYLHRLRGPKTLPTKSGQLFNGHLSRSLSRQSQATHRSQSSNTSSATGGGLVRAFDRLRNTQSMENRRANDGGISQDANTLHTLFVPNSSPTNWTTGGEGPIEAGKISPQGFMDFGVSSEQQVGNATGLDETAHGTAHQSASGMYLNQPATSPSILGVLATDALLGRPNSTQIAQQKQQQNNNLNGSLAARLRVNRYKNRQQTSTTTPGLDDQEDDPSAPLTININNLSNEKTNSERDQVAAPLAVSAYAASSQQQNQRPSNTIWTNQGQRSGPARVHPFSATTRPATLAVAATSATSPLATSTASLQVLPPLQQQHTTKPALLSPNLLAALHTGSLKTLGSNLTAASQPMATTLPATLLPSTQSSPRPPARYHHLHSHIHNIKPALISIPVPIGQPARPAQGTAYESVLAAAAAAAAAATAAATSSARLRQQQQSSGHKLAGNNQKLLLHRAQRQDLVQRMNSDQRPQEQYAIPIGGTLATALGVGGSQRLTTLANQNNSASRAPQLADTSQGGGGGGLLANLIDSASKAIKQVTRSAAHNPTRAPERQRRKKQQQNESPLNNFDQKQLGNMQDFQRNSYAPLTVDQIRQLLPEALLANDDSGLAGEPAELQPSSPKSIALLQGLQGLQHPWPSSPPTIGQQTSLTSYLAGLLAAAAASQEQHQQQQLLLANANAFERQQPLLGAKMGQNQAEESERINFTATPPINHDLSLLQMAIDAGQFPSFLSSDVHSNLSSIPDLLEGVVFAPLGKDNNVLYPLTAADKPAVQFDQLLSQLDEQQELVAGGERPPPVDSSTVLNSIQDHQGSSLVSSFDSPQWEKLALHQLYTGRSSLAAARGQRPSEHSGRQSSKEGRGSGRLAGSDHGSLQHGPRGGTDNQATRHFSSTDLMPYALGHYVDQYNSLGPSLGQANSYSLPIGHQLSPLLADGPFRPMTGPNGGGPSSSSAQIDRSKKLGEHYSPLNQSSEQQTSYLVDPSAHQPIDVISFDDNAPPAPPQSPTLQQTSSAPRNKLRVNSEDSRQPSGGGHKLRDIHNPSPMMLNEQSPKQQVATYMAPAGHQQQQQQLVQLDPAQYVYVPATELLQQALLQASGSIFRPHVISAASELLHNHKQHLLDHHLHSALLDSHHNHQRNFQNSAATVAAAARLHKVAAAAAAASDLATSESVRLGALMMPSLRGHFITHYWPLALALLPVMICVAIVAQLVMAAPLAMFALTTLAVSRVAGSIFGPALPFANGATARAEPTNRLLDRQNDHSPTNGSQNYTRPIPTHSRLTNILQLTNDSTEHLVERIFDGLYAKANSTIVGSMRANHPKKGPTNSVALKSQHKMAGS